MKKIQRLTILFSEDQYRSLQSRASQKGLTISALIRDILVQNLFREVDTRRIIIANPIKFTFRVDNTLLEKLLIWSGQQGLNLSELIRISISEKFVEHKPIRIINKNDFGFDDSSKRLINHWKTDNLLKISEMYDSSKIEFIKPKAGLIFAQTLALLGNMKTALQIADAISIQNLNFEDLILLKLTRIEFFLRDKLVNKAESLLSDLRHDIIDRNDVNRFIKARYHQLLGEVFFYREQYNTAINNLTKSLDYLDIINFPSIVGQVYIRIFQAANRSLKLELADLAFHKVKQIVKDTGNVHLQAWITNEKANSFYEQELDTKKSLELLTKSQKIQVHMQNKRGEFYGYSQMARIHLENNDFSNSYKLLKQARELELTYRPEKALSFAQINMWFIESRDNLKPALSKISNMLNDNRGNQEEKVKYYINSTIYINSKNHYEIENARIQLLNIADKMSNTVLKPAVMKTIKDRVISRNC